MRQVRRESPDLRARHDEIMREMVVRETPWGMVWFTVVIVLFDLLSIGSGIALPRGYIISDVLQGGYFLLASFLISRHIVPARYAPAVFTSAIVVNNLALNYQYTFDPAGAGAGVIPILISVYGALGLFWGPTIVASVVMFAVTSFTYMTYNPTYGAAWIITMFTAFFISFALQFGRRYMAMNLAIARQTIEQMAITDQLTGLLNRHGLARTAPSVVAIADRSGRELTAYFVDVSGLKQVNDQHGHAIGDLVIQRTAEALRAQSRASDLLARWGGDEFLVLGIGDPLPAHEFEHRIVGALDLDGLDGIWHGGVSVGTASGLPAALDDIIVSADHHMYARRNGAESMPDRA